MKRFYTKASGDEPRCQGDSILSPKPNSGNLHRAQPTSTWLTALLTSSSVAEFQVQVNKSTLIFLTPHNSVTLSRTHTAANSSSFPHPDKSGGLNASTQHWLKVHVQESTKLNSFKGVDSNGTLPCLGSD